MSLAAAQIEGCVAGARAGAWRLGPCIGWELGRWSATGTGPNGAAGEGLWSALIGGGRLAWEAHFAFLDALGGVATPLTQYEVQFEHPSETVYRAEIIGFRAALRGGIEFP
jgi:hypothetical protein